MRKLLFSFIFLGFFFSSAFASQVPVQKAAQYAKIAFAKKAQVSFNSAQDIAIMDYHTEMNGDKAAYYIFNLKPKGFVIVSADERYNPILAFSDESNFNFEDTQKMGIMTHSLSPHAQRIEYLQKNNISAPSNVKVKWKYLKETSIEQLLNSKDPDGVVIPALTTTTWDQGEFYNGYTPADSDPEAPAEELTVVVHLSL